MSGDRPLRVMVAMSGGVDSSVAAALVREAGHDVVGVTLRLWGGESDSGCCAVSDVDDARWAAEALGIDHHVFNFGDDFERHVVEPYVASHAAGETPNPCIECNRHVKFDRLARRAESLGFDAIATGHHARVVGRPDGTRRVARGRDLAKDQSYVLHMLDQGRLERTMFPVGAMTKAEVRAHARRLDLATADKPDSQDLCFITSTTGRAGFLDGRLAVNPGRVVDTSGRTVGEVPAVQLVTIGQRKGLGVSGRAAPVYVLDVDVDSAVVTVGDRSDLLVARQSLRDVWWVQGPVAGDLECQTSAHGAPRPCSVAGSELRWATPQRRTAAGQAAVFYQGDEIVGSGVFC